MIPKEEQNKRQQVFEDKDIKIEYCVKGFSLYRNGKLLHEVYYKGVNNGTIQI